MDSNVKTALYVVGGIVALVILAKLWKQRHAGPATLVGSTGQPVPVGAPAAVGDVGAQVVKTLSNAPAAFGA